MVPIEQCGDTADGFDDWIASFGHHAIGQGISPTSLSSALRVLQRGDLSVEAMVGARAGEIGQTQFLPSSYERFGIDFDGDGRVDLAGRTDDALASTAHYLAEHGWRAGEGYGAGTPNFAVLVEWNRSEVYRRTIALFASKLASAKGGS